LLLLPALLRSDVDRCGAGGSSRCAPAGPPGTRGPPRSDCARCGPVLCDDPANPATERSSGLGLGPALTESALDITAVFELRDDLGLGGLSLSGGGVGGNTLRFNGGSDCCRFRLFSSGFTRLLAAYDIFSSGLSSFAASTLFILFSSAPVKPVNV
jgi:hypothetical protein